MPLRPNSLRRRPPRFEPRPSVLIVCEGSLTEPSYFRDLRREEEVQLVRIDIDKKSGVPKTVVERAVELKRKAEKDAKSQRDANLRYDEVWCVFDVDDHPNLNEAKDQARANGIRLAVSNPCFELWFVLHFQDQTAHIHRKDIQRSCRGHIKGYKKQASYAHLRDRNEDAVKRASDLDRRHERDGQPGQNPSTAVYRLTERLHELGREPQLRRMAQLR